MIEIKDLLVDFEKKISTGEIKLKSICEAINTTTGLIIKPEDVEIKNNSLYLSVNSIYKSEIFIKKEAILEKIKQNSGMKIDRLN